MPDTHFSLAQRLFPVVKAARQARHFIDYKQAAAKVGRDPGRDYRLIAAGCDFIDAGSALCGLPLLALSTVLSSHGNINPHAFNANPLQKRYRDRIIAVSIGHIFSAEDYAAIEKKLNSLSGKTRSTSWDLVYGQEDREATYIRLSLPPFANDAINDIDPPPPATRTSVVTSYARNQNVRDAVVARANGCCEYCGKRAFPKCNDEFYLETHHIIRFADQGADTMTNVIALCPNDHREAHYGRDSKAIEAKMIDIVARLATGK